MAPKQQQQQAQAAPGQFFRWPLMGAPHRQIYEAGPCAPLTTVTLSQTQQVKAPFSHFENLDIIKSYFLQLDFTTTFTQGSGQTLSQSPLFPMNLVNSVSVSMQAAYKTMNMPGWLAQVMQMYRGTQAPLAYTMNNQNGADTLSTRPLGSTNYSASQQLAPQNLTENVGNAQTYSLFLEVPIAQYFDMYWEINPQDGSPIAAVPRAYVSPARMAATQRNVTPQVIFNPLLAAQDLYNGPVSKANADTTSTATGTVNCTWFRNGWVPTDNPLTEPVGFGWQYARMELDIQPAGAQTAVVNLADDRAGQGQILSLIFFTWDPALNSGAGGITPPANYSELQLKKGSTVVLYDDNPQMNAYRWSQKHGRSLPFGMFGWDLALNEEGKLTNESALNTLVEAGCQIAATYGTKPSNGATLYVGVESLQAVTN